MLSLLSGVGETYGLRLVEASRGKLRRNSVYVLLTRLEAAGFVKSRYVETPAGEQGPRRRVYRVTLAGSRALEAWKASESAWRKVRRGASFAIAVAP